MLDSVAQAWHRWIANFHSTNFYDEGSVHADVVGGRERIGANDRDSASPKCGALGGGSAAHGARSRKRSTTRWLNLTLLTTKESRTRSRAKRQPRVKLKKARRTAKAQKRRTHRNGAVGSRDGTKPESGKQTKQQTCLDLLGRREGATIEDLEQATGRQKHSVRGFLAGAVRKKLGLTLVSEKPTYHPVHMPCWLAGIKLLTSAKRSRPRTRTQSL